jgi:hypothetical protein
VVWDRRQALSSLDARLTRFAEAMGLTCITCELAGLPASPRLVAVETFPTFEQFCSAIRLEIIDQIANLMIKTSGF